MFTKAVAIRLLNPKGLAVLLVLLYVAFFARESLLLHAQLNTQGYDLGNFDQAIWNTAHGRLYQFTNWQGKDDYVLQSSRLGMHVEPILLLIAPLYWLWEDVRLLLVLQAVAVGCGALGIWLLANWRLQGQPDLTGARRSQIAGHPPSSWAALALVAAYLLNPGLQWAVLDDFHAVTLAAGLLPFAFYFLLRRRYGWFAVLALLIAASKEEMPLIVGLMGLYIMIFQGLRNPDRRQRRQSLAVGGLTLLIGVAWSAAAFLVVVPHFNSGSQSPYIVRYAEILGEEGLTLGNLPAIVWATVSTLLGPKGLSYLFYLLLPTAFLALFDLPILLIGTLSVAINVLSSAEHTAVVGRHYVAPLVPIVLVATVTGIAHLTRWLMHRRARQKAGVPVLAEQPNNVAVAASPAARLTPDHYHLVLALLALLASLTIQIDRGFTPLALDYKPLRLTRHHRIAQEFFQRIPADASVTTSQSLNPHLTHRQQITIFPYDLSGDYLLLDVTRDHLAAIPDINSWLDDLLRLGEYGLVDASDGLLLFKRGAPFAPVPDRFYTYMNVDDAQPEVEAQIDFGNAVRLLGFDIVSHREGEPHFVLYLQALKDLEKDYLVTLYLADDSFQPVNGIEVPQRDLVWMPTSRWQPGQTIRLDFNNLPWDSQALETYSVALGVLDGNDEWDLSQRLRPQVKQSELSPRLLAEETLFHLMQFHRQGKRPTPRPEPRQGEAPRTITPTDAQFSNWAQLLGYELASPRVERGEEMSVDLYWRALDRPRASYTVFVQLLGPDGQVYGQHDAPPGFATLATNRWSAGDLIRDSHRLVVADNAPPGQYTLIAGLYDPASGQRLSLAGSADAYVELLGVTVGPFPEEP